MTGTAIRPEEPRDAHRISEVITRAFTGAAHSDGTEAAIFQRLSSRLEAKASYVAVTAQGDIVGHIVFSEVRIDGEPCRWSGLGPLSVLPDWQGRGIGSALVERGLAELRGEWAGCVVLGDPAFYGRFGFEHDPRLVYPGAPPEYFQRIVFSGAAPGGEVTYSPAFG